jgi:(2Fe-2S) ferredoxin
MSESKEELQAIAEEHCVGEYRRHVLLCLGPDCCEPSVGDAAWQALKSELKDRGLTLGHGPKECYRTKAGCLRICTGGPIMVVYPEGTWYAGMTADRIPLFVQQHLIDDKPVEEWVFARNPLPLPETSRSS